MTIDLTIDQGDDETLDITVKKPDGSPASLVGCKLWFYVKSSPGDTDAAALIRKSSSINDGITMTNDTGGIAEIKIKHIDTSSLPASVLGRSLPWSLQVVDAAHEITTLAKGNLIINRDLISAVS